MLAGGFILFVSVGMFDLLPYRLAGPPFHLPPRTGDLVYLVFVPATFAGVVAGRAIDRFGRRAVILGTVIAGVSLMLVGLVPSVPARALAAAAASCGTVSLHVAHSGAAAAPLLAATYLRWGWPGVVLPLCGATLTVGLMALTRP